MKNIIDEIFPKPVDALKGISDSIDKINLLAQKAADEQKEELEPNHEEVLCRKCFGTVQEEERVLNEDGNLREEQVCGSCLL